MIERLCTYNHQYLFDFQGYGQVTKQYQELYRICGEGQFGIVVLSNVPIHREASEAKGNMIIDKDNVRVSKHCQPSGWGANLNRYPTFRHGTQWLSSSPLLQTPRHMAASYPVSSFVVASRGVDRFAPQHTTVSPFCVAYL
jgi:hypothetical protein